MYTLDPRLVYVTTACFYPTEQPIWRLRKSCDHFGIPLHPYGVGETFVSWRHAKVVRLIQELERLGLRSDRRYTHVLYTDGADTWFLDDLRRFCDDWWLNFCHEEDNMAVVSGETECYPLGELHDKIPESEGPYRYPNAGQFFGRIPFLIDKLREIDAAYKSHDDYS